MDHIDVTVVVVVAIAVIVDAVNVGPSGAKFVVVFYFKSVKCPTGIHLHLQGPLYVFLFPVQELCVSTQSWPYVKGC